MTGSRSTITASHRPSRGIKLSRKDIRQGNAYLKPQAQSLRPREALKTFHHQGNSLEVQECWFWSEADLGLNRSSLALLVTLTVVITIWNHLVSLFPSWWRCLPFRRLWRSGVTCVQKAWLSACYCMCDSCPLVIRSVELTRGWWNGPDLTRIREFLVQSCVVSRSCAQGT